MQKQKRNNEIVYDEKLIKRDRKMAKQKLKRLDSIGAQTSKKY